MGCSIEVADIFRAYGPAYRQAHEMAVRHLRAMRAIEICRRAELGGHVDECDHCGALRISYNSCRNRHCPKCQGLDKERWLEDRKEGLLPVAYFHLVFTLPEGARPPVCERTRATPNPVSPRALVAYIRFRLLNFTQTAEETGELNCPNGQIIPLEMTTLNRHGKG